jgi:ATP-dependent RNA helicase DDX41
VVEHSDEDKEQPENENSHLHPTNTSKEQASVEAASSEKVESLLDRVAALNQTRTAEERAETAQEQEEARILKEASKVQTNALQAASERAQGVVYEKPMPSSWRVPRYILEQGEEAWQAIRDEWHMEVQGNDIPPPLKRFVDMKFPQPILASLKQKGIARPTPIQMQGLPVALAGRDMVGIAFTGSGKTLTFGLPLVMAALEEELRMPIAPGEGPVGIILAPSRELARQTYELVSELATALTTPPAGDSREKNRYPQLRTQLLIGGESVRDQVQTVQQQGIHCVVATPGRLRDLLKRKALNLMICRYICLDEADRMLDLGFDEEVGTIMNHFPHQRQTLLFSATFPKKFQDFARQTLVQPIVVNVGRAGAANLDVIQEVEYVKQEAKIVYLLHCLQKTAPPVIIFCERKGDVDDIHEYLLLKGVQAVSIHGGKDQEERNEAITLFKSGQKDVLIATDVAAKGLDFAAIQHVINFDMPTEIENYVHRIGRTGRCGKTGVATTFINKSCEETTLLDLKGLLREARQRIPPVLLMLDDPREQNGGAGCSFCGGLGHTIVDCPKIDKDARRVAGGHKDALAGGGDW